MLYNRTNQNNVRLHSLNHCHSRVISVNSYTIKKYHFEKVHCMNSTAIFSVCHDFNAWQLRTPIWARRASEKFRNQHGSRGHWNPFQKCRVSSCSPSKGSIFRKNFYADTAAEETYWPDRVRLLCSRAFFQFFGDTCMAVMQRLNP